MTVREILLTRRGVVFVSSTGKPASSAVRGVELELAAIGYVLSARLRDRLSTASLEELDGFRTWAVATLLAHKGGDQTHEPLFRNFPRDVPHDTEALWWQKVLVHYLQADDQPCLFCGKVGTTHVLSPCRHVACDSCWDGANYSACPVCERHVDRSSPFFKPSAHQARPDEHVTFQRLDLGTDERGEAKLLFLQACARTQALSPADRAATATVLGDYRGEVLGWLPAEIPVRENVAAIFGTLFQLCPPADVLPYAQSFMTTTTDVLRFIAVLSGQDGSLQATPPARRAKPNYRFKVAKLSRALRRTLLTILEGFDGERLVEDMLRHDSMWVWVGEFLHPGEYKSRFPKVMHAFDVVRGEAKARTWASRVEAALHARDLATLVPLLAQRPGSFARRFDHVLRIAGDLAPAVVDALAIDQLATPMLVGLHAHLPRRTTKAPIRVYWPAGKVATGIAAADERALLPAAVVARAIERIDRELLNRFATKPRFESAIVDDALRTVIVPFNERTASDSAVTLPRGTQIMLPAKKWMRLFLHWCQPEKRGHRTDLDLSVAFYDSQWSYADTCSYYQLRVGDIARSAGDLQDAPFPDGATELVDLDRAKARAAGYRYAVMVVNAYRGMSFDQLERGFAGIMLRDDPFGEHFDPRTVELKFDLAGDHGVYMPAVIDLETDTLHWLDVIAAGELAFNNVATSNRAITTVCPNLIGYFGSGTRASMYELAVLHAAARSDRVYVRLGKHIAEYVRHPGESIGAFHARLVAGQADEPRTRLRVHAPAFAALYRGDLDLVDGSAIYALFRERVTPTMAAADLLG